MILSIAPEQARDAEIELAPLEELFCDGGFHHSPHAADAETRGVIGREAFTKMKKGVRIINCARGGLVDESALLRRDQNRELSPGAALDVFVDRAAPPQGHPLLNARRSCRNSTPGSFNRGSSGGRRVHRRRSRCATIS